MQLIERANDKEMQKKEGDNKLSFIEQSNKYIEQLLVEAKMKKAARKENKKLA